MGRPFQGDLSASVLTEAERQLDQRPASEISLREIAQAVGVSHVAIYRHFENLDAVFAEIAANDFRTVEQLLLAAVSEATNEEEALSAAGRAYVAFAVVHPHRFRSMYRLLGLNHRATKEAATQLFGVLSETIRQGQQKGTVILGEPASVATAALAAAHGLACLAIDNAIPPQVANPLGLSEIVASMLRR